MTRSLRLVTILAALGALAGCGAGSGGAAAPAPQASTPAAPPALTAQRARAQVRLMNGLRARNHHNARRPRHAGQATGG
jgi:hypothetical protein